MSGKRIRAHFHGVRFVNAHARKVPHLYNRNREGEPLLGLLKAAKHVFLCRQILESVRKEERWT
jgi:hypothetical protein